MPPVLSKNTEIHVSATEEGTYTLVGQVLSVTTTDEDTDDEEIFVFGSDTAIVAEEGESTTNVDLSILYDPSDTLGQTVLRTAKAAGGSVFVRMLWNGTDGTQQECRVRSVNMSSDRNGTGTAKYVTGTIGLRSIGPAEDIVGS